MTEGERPVPVLDGTRPADILVAARILREAGVVVIPTDTVYGLAASVLRPASVERVFEIKRRPPMMRVPVLLATAADLPILVSNIPRISWKLIEAFWPGALTLVMPARPSVPPAITRGGDSVAVRVPGARTALSLLESLGEPIVGTSANVSGQPSIVRGAEALDALPGVDAVLVNDRDLVGTASTVVDLTAATPVITRAGAISPDAIRASVGMRVHVMEQLQKSVDRRRSVPGAATFKSAWPVHN